jgi:hypothetical protein
MARLCIDLDQMSSSGTESSPTSISFGRTSATCTERLAVDTKRNLAKKASSILWKKQIRRWAACGPTCRRRPRPDPPLIRAAVVPELAASLNPIDAGLLPPRRATDASQRHPQNAGSTPSKPMASGQRPGIPPRQCTGRTRACLGSFLHISAIIF